VQNNKPDYYNKIDKAYYKTWELLNQGLANRNATFHIPVFICGEDNNSSGRIIVLRSLNEKEKKICFHSDIRSNKIKILKKNPKGCFLFYDKTQKIQLRISGKMKINYQNEITKKSWKKTSHMSRQCYLGKISPGTETNYPTSGLTKDIDNSKYSIKESESGYKNFCVIEAYITSIEWLYLAAKGHRRAQFTFKDDHVDKKWLIP